MCVLYVFLFIVLAGMSPTYLLFGGRDVDGVRLISVSLVHPQILHLKIDAQIYRPGKYREHILQAGEKIAYPCANFTGDEEQDRALYEGSFGSGKILAYVAGQTPKEGDCCVTAGKKILVKDFDRVTGTKLNTTWADLPLSYNVYSGDDPNFSSSMNPIEVSRKSKVDRWGYYGTYWLDPAKRKKCGSGFSKLMIWSMTHEITLKFSHKLNFGKEYRISFSGMSSVNSSLVGKSHDIDLDSESHFPSPAIHVNQLGFLPVHLGNVYVSYWSGQNHTGAIHGVKYDDVTLNWNVVLVSTDTIIASSSQPGTLRSASTVSDTQTGTNYAKSDVYSLNLTSVSSQIDSSYHNKDLVIVISGIGCSLPFQIGPSVYSKALVALLRVFYYQRNGVTLKDEWEGYKYSRSPALLETMHHTSVTLAETGNSDIGGHAEAQGFTTILENAQPDKMCYDNHSTNSPKETKMGWQDAGDWDIRIVHLQKAEQLLVLLDRFPALYADLQLGIACESGNGIPDVLNQVLFLVDSYANLQGPDGGVSGGYETQAHPRIGDTCWNQSQSYYCYEPDPWSTYIFAQTSLYAARMLKTYNFVKRAEELAQKGKNAYEWAERHRGDHQDGAQSFQIRYDPSLRDVRAGATVQMMYWQTGVYNKTLHENLLNVTRCGTSLVGSNHEDQIDSAWQTSRLDAVMTNGNSNLQNLCVASLNVLGPYVTGQIDHTSFRVGMATFLADVSFPTPPMLAGFLYDMEKKGIEKQGHNLKRLSQAMGFVWGSNPTNLVYTTDGGVDGLMGTKNFRVPLRCDSAFSENEMAPPGITVIGPLNMATGKASAAMTFAFSPMKAYSPASFPDPISPKEEEWPSFEYFVNAWMMVTEYTPHSTLVPAAFNLGFYLGAMHEIDSNQVKIESYPISCPSKKCNESFVKELGRLNKCVCGPYMNLVGGKCKCNHTSFVQDVNKCICGPYMSLENGECSCNHISLVQNENVCGCGPYMDLAGGECSCNHNSFIQKGNECVCGEYMELNSGECKCNHSSLIRDGNSCSCGPHMNFKNGQCICNEGFEQSGSVCECKTEDKKVLKSEDCVCDSSKYWIENVQKDCVCNETGNFVQSNDALSCICKDDYELKDSRCVKKKESGEDEKKDDNTSDTQILLIAAGSVGGLVVICVGIVLLVVVLICCVVCVCFLVSMQKNKKKVDVELNQYSSDDDETGVD